MRKALLAPPCASERSSLTLFPFFSPVTLVGRASAFPSERSSDASSHAPPPQRRPARVPTPFLFLALLGGAGFSLPIRAKLGRFFPRASAAESPCQVSHPLPPRRRRGMSSASLR